MQNQKLQIPFAKNVTNCRVFSELDRRLSMDSPPPLNISFAAYFLCYLFLIDRDVFLKYSNPKHFFPPPSLSHHLSTSLCPALTLEESTQCVSMLSAFGSCVKKKLSNMIPLTHCWSKFIRDIGMRNEREVKQFQLIVCLSFILLIRFTHHAYMSQWGIIHCGRGCRK